MSDKGRVRDLAKQVPWGRLLALWLVIFAAAGLVSWLAREQIAGLGGQLYAAYGLGGVALAVLLIDTYTPGFPFETVAFLPIAAGADWLTVAIVTGAASSMAGAFGYMQGRLLDRWLNLHDRFEGRPWLAKLKEYGALFVAFGAITPVPYSAINWTSGALRLPFWPCFAASWMRLLRTLLFLYLANLGWTLF